MEDTLTCLMPCTALIVSIYSDSAVCFVESRSGGRTLLRYVQFLVFAVMQHVQVELVRFIQYLKQCCNYEFLVVLENNGASKCPFECFKTPLNLVKRLKINNFAF